MDMDKLYVSSQHFRSNLWLKKKKPCMISVLHSHREFGFFLDVFLLLLSLSLVPLPMRYAEFLRP